MLLVYGMSGYTANMSTIATKIQFKLSGLFGKSGRYYEFREPLELVIEQDEDGNWHHSIAELEMHAVEPQRLASLQGLQECLDVDYEVFGKPGLKLELASARQAQEKLRRVIKSVR
jgi:hypothetical protein